MKGEGASIFILGRKSVKKFCFLMYHLFAPTGNPTRDGSVRSTPWTGKKYIVSSLRFSKKSPFEKRRQGEEGKEENTRPRRVD